MIFRWCGISSERDGCVIAVIIISLLLDESGFFESAALHVSRWGNGRGRLLFTGSSCSVLPLPPCLPMMARRLFDTDCHRHAAGFRVQ
ncbi:ArsB/NhaD family transporter [Shigella flexneri]